MTRLIVPAANPYRLTDDAVARAEAYLQRARAWLDEHPKGAYSWEFNGEPQQVEMFDE